jgi:hypothetical protein
MNVICKKSTTKLVKGATYKAVSFNNQNNKGYSFFKPTIRIYLTENSIQTFPLENFKPSVGEDFQSINWLCPDYQLVLNEREQTKIDKNLKVNDYVVPLYDSLKTLIRGRKYKVKEVKFRDHKSTYGATVWTDIKIKLEGSERFYSSWNFRKCTNQETRDIGLKEIFDEETNTEMVGKHKRKFDYFTQEEKERLLVQFLISSSCDKSRNQLDVIDWAISKSGKLYGLTRSDFDVIQNFTVSQIIELVK